METITDEKFEYVVYCRKSTESEDRQIMSLERQIEEAKLLAKRYGIKPIKIFVESQSAKGPGRIVFNEMITFIQKGYAKGIICWKLDRLSRNPIDSGTIQWLLQTGVIQSIITSDREYKPNDNAVVISVETGSANQYLLDLSTNVSSGIRRKLARGEPPHHAPIGYINNRATHQFEVDPIRAPFVIQAYEMYDTGRYSLLELLNILNTAGFTTKAGRPISKASLAHILRTPTYYGCFLHKGTLYQGVYEPIMEKPLWDRVQLRLDGKINNKQRATKKDYKYRGLCDCGECGMSITAQKTKGIIYYRCTKSKGPKSCFQGYTPENVLKPQLDKLLKGIAMGKKDIQEIHKPLLALYQKDRKIQEVAIRNLRNALSKLEEQKKTLYEKIFFGNFDVESIKMANELKAEIEKKIAHIQVQINNLSDSTYDWLEQASNLLNLAIEAPYLFEKATLDEKRQILDFVSSNRVLKDKKLHYEYNKPFDLAAKINLAKNENTPITGERPIWLDTSV